jgi:hypothetical protein
VDRALPLDEPDHLQHRILRRYRNQHVHVVRQQMPFLDPAFLLPGQLPDDLPQLPSQLPIQRLPTAYRDEHDVVLAVPNGVIQTPECVLVVRPPVCLAAYGRQYSPWTHSLTRQTSTATPAEPGGLLRWARIGMSTYSGQVMLGLAVSFV